MPCCYIPQDPISTFHVDSAGVAHVAGAAAAAFDSEEDGHYSWLFRKVEKGEKQKV